MKIPCEIVVWYLLPTIRKELAKKLVNDFGYSQSKVAKTFTDEVKQKALGQDVLKSVKPGQMRMSASEGEDKSAVFYRFVPCF